MPCDFAEQFNYIQISYAAIRGKNIYLFQRSISILEYGMERLLFIFTLAKAAPAGLVLPYE